MSITTKQIIKKIGNKYLSLYKGSGYWYFVYDDLSVDASKYDTLSVYVCRLDDMSLDQWVSEGTDFCKYVETPLYGESSTGSD